MIYGGQVTGVLMPYFSSVMISQKENIPLLFMDLKVVVMETWMSDFLELVEIGLILDLLTLKPKYLKKL
jgi:hypothetical protein